MAVVGNEAHQTLSGLSAGNLDVLEKAVGLRELNRVGSGLDARTFSLVKLAALIALDAPPASYAWQVANALEEGASAEDFIGVLRAVAPQVGGPRVVAAAPEIMVAMGLALEQEEGL
jgi:alkylhydroperoxidase/carboxymuconolactone decarboxylase family protein YurZ